MIRNLEGMRKRGEEEKREGWKGGNSEKETEEKRERGNVLGRGAKSRSRQREMGRRCDSLNWH